VGNHLSPGSFGEHSGHLILVYLFQKSFLGPKQGNFNVIDERVLDNVKMTFLLPEG
jgi:hypothetical protein